MTYATNSPVLHSIEDRQAGRQAGGVIDLIKIFLEVKRPRRVPPWKTMIGIQNPCDDIFSKARFASEP